MIKELTDLFSSAADRKIAEKQSAYLRNLFPYFGIPTPQRELLEKEILKTIPSSELKKTLLLLWNQDQREFQYSALALAQRHRKTLTPALLPTLEKMIRTKSWWDTVDMIAPNLIGHLVQTHGLSSLMDKWIEDPYLWIRRSAIIHQLRFKEKTDEKRLFLYCEKTSHEKEFFIRKAIGWALREYSKTNPRSVKQFLSRTELSPLSVREASKYI